MKEFLKNLWMDYVLAAVITVLAGLLITVFYQVAMDVVCVLLGIIAVLIGLFSMFRYFKAPAGSQYIMLMSLIFCAIGIYIICNPVILQNVVAIVLGIGIIYHGIIDLQNTVIMSRARYPYWWVALLISLVTLAAGIVLIVLQNTAIQSLTLIAGIMLMVEGLMDIWVAVKVKKFNG